MRAAFEENYGRINVQHNMKLSAQPFERMRDGFKTIELRINDPKRQGMAVGDTILFRKLPDLDEHFTMRIVELLRFSTFAALIDAIPAAWMGYDESDKPYLRTSMYEIYTREEEAAFGVVGIRVEKI